MDQTFMKTKKVLPLVCEMALPMVLSMLVNSLYNIIDSFFVAKISADAMTALSLMFPLQNIVGAVSIGFGIGVNAAVAYFNGADRKDLAEQSASLGVILSILHGISLTIIMLLVMPHFLGSFGASEAVLDAGIRDRFFFGIQWRSRRIRSCRRADSRRASKITKSGFS